MGLILKIAFRNIQRHKGKSLVIGVILFLGALIMTVGNGVLSGMDRGLTANIVNGFTGHVVLVSSEQESDNVLFEFMGKSVEPINNFPQVKDVLGRQDYVKRFLPAGKNAALILNDEGGAPGFAFLIGVDYAEYRQMFPDNLKAVEGRLMGDGEQGVMIATSARKDYYDYTSIWFVPEGAALDTANLTPEAKKSDLRLLTTKDSVVFMGMNNDNSTTDIRLGVKGIVKYRALNKIWGSFSIVDIESYRRCLGYFAVSDMEADLSDEQRSLLAMDSGNLDDLFGSSSFVKPDRSPASPDIKTAGGGNAGPAPVVDLEAGAYNLVFVLLNKGISAEEGARRLNAVLEAEKAGVRAISWKKASGMIGSMSVIIKGALFVFVMFLFFVAVIIIVNTLSMAAIERTPEIGMMRAIGARRGFIGRMFLGETAMLSFLFGGLGIVAGIAVVDVIVFMNISTNNDILQLLYGGDTFRPVLTVADIGLAVVQLALVTGVAVLYPLALARGITPLDAVTRE